MVKKKHMIVVFILFFLPYFCVKAQSNNTLSTRRVDEARIDILKRKDAAGPRELASFSSGDLALIPHHNRLHNTVLFVEKQIWQILIPHSVAFFPDAH